MKSTYKNTNKPYNTTIIVPKSLRDSLQLIKNKCNMKHTHEVITLLLNTFDPETSMSSHKPNKEAIGNQSDALELKYPEMGDKPE